MAVDLPVVKYHCDRCQATEELHPNTPWSAGNICINIGVVEILMEGYGWQVIKEENGETKERHLCPKCKERTIENA